MRAMARRVSGSECPSGEEADERDEEKAEVEEKGKERDWRGRVFTADRKERRNIVYGHYMFWILTADQTKD